MELRDYFDKVLTLEPGEKIMIPCANEKVAESVRVQLTRMRRVYASRVDQKAMQLIGVFKQELDKKFFVVLEQRERSESAAFILTKEGEMKPLDEDVSEERAANLRRIVEKAIEDDVKVEDLIDELDGMYDLADIVKEYAVQVGVDQQA